MVGTPKNTDLNVAVGNLSYCLLLSRLKRVTTVPRQSLACHILLSCTVVDANRNCQPTLVTLIQLPPTTYIGVGTAGALGARAPATVWGCHAFFLKTCACAGHVFVNTTSWCPPNCIHRNSFVYGCFLDASKAFDLVDHKLLFTYLSYPLLLLSF